MDRNTPLVITISRQLGCGGACIGQQLAKRLGIYYADRDILHKAAEELSVLEEDLGEEDEKVTAFWYNFMQVSPMYGDVYYPPQIYPPQLMLPTSGELFDTEAKIMEKIARERSAVIIGRCGFHVLRDHPNCINVFLHGKREFRIGRIQKLYNVSEKEAEKMVTESDKTRAKYIHTFTAKQWSDMQNYHLCIDTGKTGVDNSTELIMKYVELIRASGLTADKQGNVNKTSPG